MCTLCLEMYSITFARTLYSVHHEVSQVPFISLMLGTVCRQETKPHIYVSIDRSHDVSNGSSLCCSLTDDQGYADVGFTTPSSPFVTPNIDQLAANSIRCKTINIHFDLLWIESIRPFVFSFVRKILQKGNLQLVIASAQLLLIMVFVKDLFKLFQARIVLMYLIANIAVFSSYRK